MAIELLPAFIRENYECHEWRHACAVLKEDFPQEWADIIDVMTRFRLNRSHILQPGGRKSLVSEWIDSQLLRKGLAGKEV